MWISAKAGMARGVLVTGVVFLLGCKSVGRRQEDRVSALRLELSEASTRYNKLCIRTPSGSNTDVTSTALLHGGARGKPQLSQSADCDKLKASRDNLQSEYISAQEQLRASY